MTNYTDVQIDPLDNAQIDQAAAERRRLNAIQQALEYKRTHRREFCPSWYEWQHRSFMSETAATMLMAGNRTGKTMSAGYHFALDVTGDYPDWWVGPRFAFAPNCMALGVDNTQLKNVVQKELFGDVIEVGGRKTFSGNWIHPHELRMIEWSSATSGLAQSVTVATRRGPARILLRSYSQSKTGSATLSFAGTSLDLIWVDECPPDELVGQLTVRTATGGMGQGGKIRYTLTPELGVTQLVHQFLEEPDPSRTLIGPVAWRECAHITPEIEAQVLAGIPEHEHDMRREGVPFFGSGLVYPIAEDRIKCDPFIPPAHFRVIRAMDLGIRHPTAIAWLAHDIEQDVIYLVKTYSSSGEAAAVHANAANSFLDHAPVVMPPDVDTVEKGSGKSVREFYEDAGLKNIYDFRNPDKSVKVEPGIMEIMERMRDGRFKVCSNCTEFWREFRLYHRDEKGKLVKENDDVMDAVRYGVQMLPRYGVYALELKHQRPGVKRAMAGKDRRGR